MGGRGNLGPQITATKRPGSGAGGSQSELAMGMLLGAQPAAAQQDIRIGNQLEAMRLANLNLEQRLAMDVQFVEATNDRINAFNDRTLPVLKAITGQDLGPEPEKWKAWWTDQLGYVYQSNIPATKPTYSDFVGVAGHLCPLGVLRRRHAGATVDGPRPIESIRVGDRVLSQGTSTGTLALSARGRHAPNAVQPDAPDRDRRRDDRGNRHPPLLESRQGLDHGPRAQARRSPRGYWAARSRSSRLTADQVQPVYNLDVAENRDFFVGTRRLLVHDYSFVQPVLEPFDRQPDTVEK